MQYMQYCFKGELMRTVTADFRQRSETIEFYRQLRRRGVDAQVIGGYNGCGLSCEFEERGMNTARNVLDTYRFRSFDGFGK
jgi:hypothetical protein